MAQEKSQKPIQAVKLPDLSTMTDEEIDEFATSLWEQISQQS